MKTPVFASLAALLAFAGATQAAITGNLPPNPITTWTPVADNGNSDTVYGPGPTPPSSIPQKYRSFDAPVMDQYTTNVAFKARLRGGVTLANDEGVWSSGNFTTLSQVLREGNPTGGGVGQTFGFSNSLQIRNLQMANLGRTICQANTSHASGTGKAVILDGAFATGALQHNLMETPTTAWKDLRPPVINQFLNAGHVGLWAQRPLPLTSGVAHFGFAFNSNNPASFYPGMGYPFASGFAVGYHANQPARIGSPSINYYADMAVFVRNSAGPSQRHIDLVDEFGVHTQVARENFLANNLYAATATYAPASATFGVFHTRLMANCGHASGFGGTAGAPMVAWQMATMLTGGGATPSLWCQQGTANNCIAYVGQTDTHTGLAFTSFHALHAVPVTASPWTHHVFFGAELNGTFSGIYRCVVTSGSVVSVDLIATDAPGFTPVDVLGHGPQNIVSYSKFFSVNSLGHVFFRAKTSAPFPNSVSLVTASPGNNHALIERAQTGLTFSSASYSLPALEFQLAAPDQGTWSRGQAISNRGVAVKVIMAGTRQALFVGN